MLHSTNRSVSAHLLGAELHDLGRLVGGGAGIVGDRLRAPMESQPVEGCLGLGLGSGQCKVDG